MDANVYTFETYREFVTAKIDQDSQKWGLQTRLAAAIDCQQAYLSKVISGKADLSFDQGFALTKFWKMNAAETEFFLLLLQRDRAAQSDSRNYLTRQIQACRKENENISARVQAGRLQSAEMASFYYSAWHWSALHLLTSIPEFQQVPPLAARLSLSPAFIERSLLRLQEYGLVRYESGCWKYQSADLHTPKDSPFTPLYHGHWRQRGVQDSSDPESDGIHYTAVYILSQKDYLRMKEMVLQFIEDTRKVAGPSTEEEASVLTFDFFRLR